MAYLSLYRKYRPQTFAELLGQEPISRTLSNAITEDRVAHAYLFTGPRGTGKTSTARILAKALNCERGPTPNPCGECESCVSIAEGSSLDVIEMDAASHSKVDEAREILAGVPLATAGSRRKVYVIDEVHMLSTQAFNALLKTLEEPPPHVLFILATTEAHKVLPTIVSRTQRFDFRRVPADVLETHLAEVAKLENIDIEPDAVGVVARFADGSVRDALSVLDQLASLGGGISAEDTERLLGERSEEVYIELFDAIVEGDVAGVFAAVQSMVAQGADLRQVALGVLSHARSLLLIVTAPDADQFVDATLEDRADLVAQAQRFTASSLLRVVDLAGKALTEMRNAPNHRLLLEIALVRAAAPETDPSALGLLGRIERLERRIGIEGEAVPPAAEVPPPVAPVLEPTRRAPTRTQRAQEPKSSPQPSAAPEAAGAERAASGGVATEPVPAPVSAAAVGFSHVKDAWQATLQEVSKKSKRVWGLLNPSRPVRFEEDTLVVEVQHPYHRDEMNGVRHRRFLADALHAALGIRPDLTFVARSEEPGGAGSEPETVTDLSEAEGATDDAPDPIELVKKGLAAEVVEER